MIEYFEVTEKFSSGEFRREFNLSTSAKSRFLISFEKRGVIERAEKIPGAPRGYQTLWRSMRYKRRPIEVFRQAIREIRDDSRRSQAEVR